MSITLNMRTWGEGTPRILLLHGLADGAFVWNHIAPAVAAQTPVAAVELRGHGDSPHDPKGCYESALHAADVLEVMTSCFAGNQLTLIGHSLGAEVAIHLTYMAREKVSELVLVDGGPGLNPSALRHIHDEFLGQPWFHETVGSFATQLQRRHPLAHPQLLQGIAEHALRPLPSGGYELKCDRRLLSAERATDDTVLWERLRSFDGPIRVIRGAASAVLSRAGAARMVTELPDCRLHTVPQAGHSVMLDNPAEFLTHLLWRS